MWPSKCSVPMKAAWDRVVPVWISPIKYFRRRDKGGCGCLDGLNHQAQETVSRPAIIRGREADEGIDFRLEIKRTQEGALFQFRLLVWTP